MRRRRRTSSCERARPWISRELDGELSEFEQSALGLHLEQCASCRAERVQIRGFTAMIRAEPLVEVTRTFTFQGSRPGRTRLAWRGAAAVALAGAAIGAAGAFLAQSPAPASSALGFRSVPEQKRFVLDHVRAEPRTRPVAAVYRFVPLPSLAARALR